MNDMHVIQNPDINVGPAAYKKLGQGQLLITSIFYTVQGEGPFAGYPAVFVRLAGCNRGRKHDMGCRFCDTAFHHNLGTAMAFEDIRAQMLTVAEGRRTSKPPLVVITGGEPMMQNNVAQFCHFLKYGGFQQVQIESNGDRLVPGLPPGVCLVVSPKVSHNSQTKEWEYREPNPDVYDRANYFKFVVECQPGSPYGKPPLWADISARPVYVSPLTHYARPVMKDELPSAWNSRLIDVARTRANYAFAAAMAMEHNYLISTQQHLFYGVP